MVVFEKLCIQFRTKGSTQRTNALLRYHVTGIIGIAQNNSHYYTSFTNEEADKIILYYSRQLIGKIINGNPSLVASELKKEMLEENVYVVKVYTEKENYNSAFVELTHYTRQLGILTPIEVLKNL